MILNLAVGIKYQLVQIKDALCLIDVKLLDYIIMTEEGFYSFVEEGIL
ncbi:MAG: hypothetical protein J0I09_04385 [Sphingobacteriia bacterium]|nr:hypothetical protein [Sphingobacteriia bacterium]